jgi:hypothetical protein
MADKGFRSFGCSGKYAHGIKVAIWLCVSVALW